MHPEYCAKLIRDCKDKRFCVNDEEQQQEAIEMTQEWAEELKQFKQFSRSKGKFMHLLKKKSKVALAEKPRKKFKAYTPQDFAQDIEKQEQA